MSFATLSGTLAECSAISRLELTKNPFDSGMEDRLNLPALSSPSIFTKQETPGSQKVKERLLLKQPCSCKLSFVVFYTNLVNIYTTLYNHSMNTL